MAIIGHIDLDAFFASVEERDKPYLRGLPVVVGADPQGGEGRGVVATANYKARAYGIHSAQPVSTAWRHSEAARAAGKPAVAFVSGSHRRYREASRGVFDVVSRHVSLIEQVSIDEARLDLSHCKTYRAAKEAMRRLKQDIQRQTALSCSIGVGPNTMIAKLACEQDKPDGLTVITPGRARDFLAPMRVGELPGVGPKTAAALARRGITTVAKLRAHSWERLVEWFGKHGFSLFDRAWGVAGEAIGEMRITKSIGKHTTYARDTLGMREIFATLAEMSEEVARLCGTEGFRGFRTVELTVRFADFTTRTRRVTSPEPLADGEQLHMRAIGLVLPFFDHRENPRKQLIRLVGLRVTNLT